MGDWNQGIVPRRNHERVVAAIEEMKREKDRCRAACEQMRLAADAAWQ